MGSAGAAHSRLCGKFIAMKVLHVIPSIGPLRGGPSQAVLDICRGLAQTGVEVTLATTDDNGMDRLNVPLGKPISQDGYTILYFPRSARLYTVSWPLAHWLYQQVREYDFVHAHAVFSFAPLVAAFWASRQGIPYAITTHGVLLSWGLHARRARAKQISFRHLERPLLNRAAFVHVTSNREAQELRNLEIRSQIEVIYLGIDMRYFGKVLSDNFIDYNPHLKKQTTFLFIGRFDPIKGLDLLLPAFARAQQKAPHIMLALAGDGSDDYKAWLNAVIKQLGIEQHVLFLGFLTGDAKWRALQSCDVFVLPSYSESFGVAVVEAMAAGKPVIISDQVAIQDTILAAQAGLVVTCNTDELTEKILQMAINSNLREKMGIRGRHLVEEKFTLYRLVEQLKRQYVQHMRDTD
ncbi:MAG: glycosyltransferase [Aggregatilineales bacterium]